LKIKNGQPSVVQVSPINQQKWLVNKWDTKMVKHYMAKELMDNVMMIFVLARIKILLKQMLVVKQAKIK
jgi:hypothetical protein